MKTRKIFIRNVRTGLSNCTGLRAVLIAASRFLENMLPYFCVTLRCIAQKHSEVSYKDRDDYREITTDICARSVDFGSA